jgi:outer membrane protein
MNRSLATIITTALTLLSAPLQAEDLLEVTHYALEQDQQLAISRLDLSIQQEQQYQAAALLLPSLSTAASYEYGDNSRYAGQNRTTAYSFNLTQSLYHPELQKQLEQTAVLTEERKLVLNLTQQQLLLRVATAYFDQLSAEDSLQLAQQEHNAIAEQLKQVHQKYEVGSVSMIDRQEVQARFDLVNAQQISAKAAVSNSREVLFEMVNHELSALQPLMAELTTDRLLAPPTLDGVEPWIKQAINNNIELQQLEKQLRSATLSTEIAQSAYHPKVDLIAQLASSDNSNSNYGSDSENYSVGIQATLPLFNGGSTRSKVTQARLQRARIELQQEQKKRSIIKTIRSNYLVIQTAIELIKAQAQAQLSAQSAFRATRSGMEVGTRTTADLLDAQRELYSTQRDLARSKYELILARLNLKQSAGVLSLEDIEGVNRLLD